MKYLVENETPIAVLKDQENLYPENSNWKTANTACVLVAGEVASNGCPVNTRWVKLSKARKYMFWERKNSHPLTYATRHEFNGIVFFTI